MIAYLSVLVLVLGLILYVLPLNAKVCELGRLSFFAGLLVTLAQLAGKMAKLL